MSCCLSICLISFFIQQFESQFYTIGSKDKSCFCNLLDVWTPLVVKRSSKEVQFKIYRVSCRRMKYQIARWDCINYIEFVGFLSKSSQVFEERTLYQISELNLFLPWYDNKVLYACKLFVFFNSISYLYWTVSIGRCVHLYCTTGVQETHSSLIVGN